MRAQHIGYAWPAFDLVIERGSAIAFARGLDETDPIYLDEAAARAILADDPYLKSSY